MRARIRDGYNAVSMQGLLTQLGYDAGPLGNIEAPRLQAAIEQAKRDVGLDADLPLRQLWAIQFLLKAAR